MPDANTIFAITSRTIQARFLLKPSRAVNEIILGIIGRAQTMFPLIDIYCFVFLSNHFEVIGSAPDFDVISEFTCYIKSNIARELGSIYGWREKFWGRRFTALSVLDEPALIDGIRYVLAHGCKENLVARPEDWPGVHCVAALTRGKPLVGKWIDRTAAYNAARKGRTIALEDFTKEYEVRLSPLPIWADLGLAEQQGRWRELVEDIEQETRERHQHKGSKPLGAAQVLAQHPHDHPMDPKRSPAPACHASSRLVREWFKRSYRRFVSEFREASEKFRAGDFSVAFPVRCFRPPIPYLPVAVLSTGLG